MTASTIFVYFLSIAVLLSNSAVANAAKKKSTLKFTESQETITTTKTLKRIDPTTGNGQDDQLSIQLELSSTKFKKCGDLIIWASITNKFPYAITLDSSILGHPNLVLEFRKRGTIETFKVGPTSPSQSISHSELRLESQQTWKSSYGGNSFCTATALENGPYEVRFRYQNSSSEQSQWVGEVASSWMPFEIQPNHLMQK